MKEQLRIHTETINIHVEEKNQLHDKLTRVTQQLHAERAKV